MIRAIRWTCGVAGVALIGYGAHRIVSGGIATSPADLARWLIGGVLGHDLLIAGVTGATGWLLSRVVPARARPAVVGGLLVAGSLVLISIPVLSGRGGHGNPTTDPLDYPRNLAIAIAAVAAGTGLAAWWSSRRNASPPPLSTSDSPDPGPPVPR
jgi:hypothetical protein